MGTPNMLELASLVLLLVRLPQDQSVLNGHTPSSLLPPTKPYLQQFPQARKRTTRNQAWLSTTLIPALRRQSQVKILSK